MRKVIGLDVMKRLEEWVNLDPSASRQSVKDLGLDQAAQFEADVAAMENMDGNMRWDGLTADLIRGALVRMLTQLRNPLIRVTDRSGSEPPECFPLSEIEGIEDDERKQLSGGKEIEIGGSAAPLVTLTPVIELGDKAVAQPLTRHVMGLSGGRLARKGRLR